MKYSTPVWKPYRVDEIFDFVKSYAISRDNLQNWTDNAEGVGNIHYGDIHTIFAKSKIDMKRVSIPMIKDRSFVSDREAQLKNGDILMVDASEDYEGIGLTTTIHNIGNKEVVGGLHTFVLRDNKGLTSEYFRQYVFRNPTIHNSLQKIANGVSVYGISKKALSKLQINIPSVPEQNRIVVVLETWDKAIEMLKNKIKNKKQAKKLLTSKLLSGEKRVPGHTGEWLATELQKISSINMGQSPSSTAYNELGKGLPLIQGNNDIKNRMTVTRIWTTEVAKIAEKGDIIMTVRAPVGLIGSASQKACLGRGVCSIRPTKIHAEYLMKLLESYENKWKSLEQGSTFFAVNSCDIKSLPLLIPTSTDEQIAIANILMDADKELDLLNKKLSLIQDEKRYLLNNLITGTIRTPENLSVN